MKPNNLARVWSRRLTGLGLVLSLLAGCSSEPTLPGDGDDTGRVVVYRDTWGVPHIYALSAVAGCYAMGWAQAQDRPEELLKNFLRGMGEVASVEGPDAFQSDSVARIFDHYGVAQRGYEEVSPEVQAYLRAYVAGVNDYYRAHPEDRPEWWGDREVDEFMVIAFGRLFLYSWSIDDGFGDLARGGIRPGREAPQRGSNQFAVSPSRSAEGAAILAIDPHLSWWGPSRFWEFRIHAGKLRGSGFTLPGFPSIGLGHNENLAWAMTTGGPDTADIYELPFRDGDPPAYRDGTDWVDFAVRDEEIALRGAEARKIKVLESRFGPVVAVRGNKAYALRTSYAEEVRILDAWYAINFAENYQGVLDAAETQQVFPQNIMSADTSGNIHYLRVGRVPVRPAKRDWSKPVTGGSDADWNGLHPVSDLVQTLNPAQGYMQNCNIPPDAMMVDSPLVPDRYPAEIYSDRGHGPLGGWSNQRGGRAVEILAADASMTADEAIAAINDIQPYGVHRWIDALARADAQLGKEFAGRGAYAAGVAELNAWNRQLDRDSAGALKYYYWRRQLLEDHGPEGVRALSQIIDNDRASLGDPSRDLAELKPSHLKMLASSMAAGQERLQSEQGRTDAVFGDVFRVGRGDASWPVGGGGPFLLGMTTLRNVGYEDPRPDHTRWGRSGQSATQIVILSKPVRSWTSTPIGQSDRPDSPHYRDQAEKLFSPRQMKPSWWLPEELAQHIESRTVLERPQK